jgi:hypothetical protein
MWTALDAVRTVEQPPFTTSRSAPTVPFVVARKPLHAEPPNAEPAVRATPSASPDKPQQVRSCSHQHQFGFRSRLSPTPRGVGQVERKPSCQIHTLVAQFVVIIEIELLLKLGSLLVAGTPPTIKIGTILFRLRLTFARMLLRLNTQITSAFVLRRITVAVIVVTEGLKILVPFLKFAPTLTSLKHSLKFFHQPRLTPL